jgi:hypothetical protein
MSIQDRPQRERGQFAKGHTKIPGSGQKAGVHVRNTRLLKDAILLGGEAGANLLVQREIIERAKDESLKKDGERVAGELEQCVAENGALVGYLAWLSVEHPSVYGSLLGRVLPLQVKIDSHKTVEYRTVEDIQRDIDALKLPMERIAPLLLDKYVRRERDTQIEDASDAVLDDAEADRGRGDY